ncbi:NAD(P)-binding Rossmann-fold containing protein [Glarea lozoyensis ATCC 20868]|uniref:NAD(P)-binding Rossmann-fold containing protein n=1 Tax=Glarea lozoyensis (strain ATCC 20868 / MF5171) TaxID=1116229 RepID=S3D0U9_GLAL2|nr:NAD(P)-binding Rossmann-fold containing protein [Glarea lozoyensis ATCC 20868]EPE25656.1 NAD(P)-binding Rossmann-fold containing protein [Glarea lozoyensis ATCC 20868]
MSPKTWLITGSSSGLGLSLTLLLLRNGQQVIATSRDPSKTPSLVAQVTSLGGQWLSLDVTLPAPEIASVIDKAIGIYGEIDVLVNCAGYAQLGAFEAISEAEVRAQMETNYFGPLKLTSLLLPFYRRRGSGTIVQISSTAGIEAKASRSAYCASKYALEAMSESLYHEVNPLGIRVLLVELGAFRTKFAANCVLPASDMPIEYHNTITEQMIDAVTQGLAAGKAPGDIEKASKAIMEVVMKEGQGENLEEFIRLPLGKDNAERWKVKIEELTNTLEGTKQIWSNTDHDDLGV